jgi:RNA polymerase sigma factor (TIGR02999 family)
MLDAAPIASPRAQETKLAAKGAASEQLFAALYNELHRLSQAQLRRHGFGVSLNATTLVHEAYIAMQGREELAFTERGRFMAYAARAMRGLIVDHARSRGAIKRGGDLHITALDTQIAENVGDLTELEAINEAVEQLATIEPALAEVVELKFFCGFSFSDIAAMQNVSERTVQRQWEKARIFLFQAIRKA